MPETHAVRRGRLRAALAELGAEAALVTRLVNVRYLTGFTGSHGALLITHDRALLATDGRYTIQAGQQCPDVELVVERAASAELTARAAASGVRRLAFEEHAVTVEEHARLLAAADGTGLVFLGRAVETLRAVKDDAEVAVLRRACAISDQALAETLPAVAAGRTERSIARELESRMVSLGAEAPAFETIVAAGPHSAVPHHRPTERAVARGDLLKIDFGARVDGYHADMTRTFVVGREAAQWQSDLHALVAAAQRAGRRALAPGAVARDIDAAARSVIAAAGQAEHFPHGLGHGVGLEIHEAPMVTHGSTAILDDGMPVTVDPGVYLPGRGGVRIEDTLVVRGAGGAAPELLTTTTKELLVLG